MNQKGSAVALVLVVLGVISIIGAAALLQSRYHLWSATASQTQDKMFYLADGASAISTKELSRLDDDPIVQVDADTGLPVPARTIIDDAEINKVGSYLAQMVFYNYDTSMEAAAGYEESYYVQHWDCQGYSKVKRFLETLSPSQLSLTKEEQLNILYPEAMADYQLYSKREEHRDEFSAGKQVSTAAFAYRKKN
jgi:hypothetical protein